MAYEVDFVVPFEILYCGDFADDWEPNSAVFSMAMCELCRLLNVNIDAHALAKEYVELERGTGDIHVFFDKQKEVFIFVDLYLGHTDQHNMVVLGIHVPLHMKESAKDAMFAIYNDENAIPKSNFNEYNNNELFANIDKKNYPKKYEFYMQDIVYHY